MDVKVPYMDDIIESQLVESLANPEHWRELLVQSDKLPTLQDKLNFLDMVHMSEKPSIAEE